MDDFEKRWKRIQDQLRIQMNGDEQPRFSSGRTLFGIRSEAEEKMDRFAREIEEEARRRRLAHRERKGIADQGADAPIRKDDPPLEGSRRRSSGTTAPAPSPTRATRRHPDAR